VFQIHKNTLEFYTLDRKLAGGEGLPDLAVRPLWWSVCSPGFDGVDGGVGEGSGCDGGDAAAARPPQPTFRGGEGQYRATSDWGDSCGP
jgi:hypothetical protein